MITKRDNFCLNSAALAIGTVPTGVKSANAVSYNIAGVAYTKAASDPLIAMSGTALTTHQVCAFFIMINAAGTVSLSQSDIKTASTGTGYVAGAFEWPDPSDKACIGAVLIKSGAAVFTPGTTALTSVATYINVGPDYGTPIAY